MKYCRENKKKEINMLLIYLGAIRRTIFHRISGTLSIHMGQLPVLDYIALHPECTQAEIAKELMITPTTIAISTKRMEKAGLIIKEADQENLRKNRISLTERGIEISKAGNTLIREVEEAMLKDFSDKELDVIKALISKMIKNIQNTEFYDPEGNDMISFKALEGMMTEKERRNEE